MFWIITIIISTNDFKAVCGLPLRAWTPTLNRPRMRTKIPNITQEVKCWLEKRFWRGGPQSRQINTGLPVVIYRTSSLNSPLAYDGDTAGVGVGGVTSCKPFAIMASPTKSYSLDPFPTFILKDVLDVVLPYSDTHVQRITVKRTLAGLTATRHHHTTVKEIIPRSSGAEELPSSF